jgi:hypothetical protein
LFCFLAFCTILSIATLAQNLLSSAQPTTNHLLCHPLPSARKTTPYGHREANPPPSARLRS